MPISSDEIDQVLETLETATEENRVSSMRAGQVVHLPADGEVWVTGDLHDHRRNFAKFVAAADLRNNPRRHVILHEIIHGDHFDENRAEDSWRMLVQAATLKCDFSSQVHFLIANHDLAQIQGDGIQKAGLSVCEAFKAGVKRDFGTRRSTADVAITELLLSFPLAIRTASGLWISHSIPGDEQIPTFDYSVFGRALTGEDYRRRVGPVYQLVWGRKTSPQAAGEFADRVGAKLIITGHQPQESGYAVNGDRQLIIASDHNQGVFVPLSLAENYDMDGLVGRIRKFVALEMPEEPAREAITITEEPGGEAGDGSEAQPPSPAVPAGDTTPERVDAVSDVTHGVSDDSVVPGVSGANAAGEVPGAIAPGENGNIPEAAVGAERESVAAAAPGVGEEPPPDYPLPGEGQRAAFGQMIATALFEIRTLASNGRAAQAADLAGTVQGLATGMYGWERWDPAALRAGLDAYQRQYPAEGQEQPDYVAWFDQIFSSAESLTQTPG